MQHQNECPLMAALVERHGVLRAAEAEGRKLAREGGDYCAEQLARTRATLDALRANPMIGTPPKVLDHEAFARRFNNPLGSWTRKYIDHG